MTLPVPSTSETLPLLLDRARAALAGARTSAEVLEARDMAAATYDAASRFTRRKAAFDHMTALALRMQAEALKIEARAKERLADEYDAAQERGEVAGHGRSKVEADNVTTVANLRLRRDEIHAARRLRDAERADPGAIDRTVDQLLASGQRPTRAALKRELGLAPRPTSLNALPDDAYAVELRRHAQWCLQHPYFHFGAGTDEDRRIRIALRHLTDDERDLIRSAAACLARLVKEIDHADP